LQILKKLIILYVEREQHLIDRYLPILKSSCDKLYVAKSGEEAYRLYKEKMPNIVIMDLDVSKLNNTSLARKIRENDDNTILIALSDYPTKDTLLEILNLNFSSYLVKPVDNLKLKQTLIEISKKIDSGKIIYLKHNCIWNSASKTLFYKNEPIFLTKKEQKLFELLVQKNGMVCSDEEILFFVWEDDFDKTVTNASIRTLVKNLRKKIPKNLIKNQYGVGYKLDI
jgi:DNA-binding response OmpR family regulator